MILREFCLRLGESLSDEDQVMLPILVEFSAEFLHAGGTITLQDMRTLAPVEFMALAAAGRRLRIEQAVRIGHASQGPLEAATALESVDGGAARDQILADVAVAAAARARNGE